MKEFKQTLKFLHIFMITVSIVIIVRLIIMILYEISSYIIITQFVAKSLLVSLYLSELALVVMMSMSIKETTKT